MVGGVNNTNIFAALGSLKKKKSKSKDEASSNPSGSQVAQKKDLFWSPTPLTAKSWADVEDEDDDDYYATTAPPESPWLNPDKPNQSDVAEEESESDEEGFEDEEDDAVEEHENDFELPEDAKHVLEKTALPSLATKDTERQLSKKELKKKGLEELEAVLAELGYTQGEPSGHDNSHGPEKKENDHNGAVIRENVSGESKSSRKKKKKDKSSKEQKESQNQSDGMDVGNISETAAIEKAEDVSSIDVKERLKKVTSIKKKKSSKEMDAAARAAASEAAARSAKLAAAKKKEKAHYNQQPVR
ncbi:hypothetical protein Fmac_008609 [Flemingia macrophylla]|uniref:Uncharacterized protein n=1 Tax=Flemingia macrophylla TaxID=520843 RepID=A0ABD1MXV3_9FABA